MGRSVLPLCASLCAALSVKAAVAAPDAVPKCTALSDARRVYTGFGGDNCFSGIEQEDELNEFLRPGNGVHAETLG